MADTPKRWAVRLQLRPVDSGAPLTADRKGIAFELVSCDLVEAAEEIVKHVGSGYEVVSAAIELSADLVIPARYLGGGRQLEHKGGKR